MTRRIVKELLALGLTIGASLITLITLSGQVQTWALLFTLGGFALHLLNVAISDEGGESEPTRNETERDDR
jgi:hypothetical protein